MSIEALPNELLVQIFNHLSWTHLSKDVSLVNRRWYQVVGMASLTRKTTLNLSRLGPNWTSNSDDYVCIPLEVLRSSSREYTEFSCSLQPLRKEQMVYGSFGVVLQYCYDRWNIKSLCLTAYYHQFEIFLIHHKNLLNNVVKANFVVQDIPLLGETPRDTETLCERFDLSLEKLQKLDFDHTQFYDQSPPYDIVLKTPNLETINIRRCVLKNNVRLELHSCPKLRSLSIFSQKPLCLADITDPWELDDIVSQKVPHFTHLKLTNVPIRRTMKTMFRSLRYIYLAYVRIVPTDDVLDCENLTELVVHSLLLKKSLKLKVPRLQILNCDMDVLKLLDLQDAFQADQLIIDMFYESAGRNTDMVNLSGLSHFRRLLLKPNKCYCYDVSWFTYLWSHLLGVVELEVRGEFPRDPQERLQDLLKCFTQISSLRLQRINIPNDLRFLPSNVKTIYIEDCSVVGSSVQFSPSVESVRVHRLWNKNEDMRRTFYHMQLQPANKFQPLLSMKFIGTPMGRRMAYSSSEEHQSGSNR